MNREDVAYLNRPWQGAVSVKYRNGGGAYDLAGTWELRLYKNGNATPFVVGTVANGKIAVNAGTGIVTRNFSAADIATTEGYGSAELIRTDVPSRPLGVWPIRFVPPGTPFIERQNGDLVVYQNDILIGVEGPGLDSLIAAVGNALPRDGSLAMAAPLILAGDAVSNLAAVPKQQLDAKVPILRNLYLMGDSWFYVDQSSPLNSFKQALQGALDATFGATSWKVINAAIGGTAISMDVPVPGVGSNMVTRIDTRVLKYSGVTAVALQGGLNDLALGQDDAEIIAGIQAQVAKLAPRNIPFIIYTIPPFKGAGFYNATTRGYADSVRNFILTTYGGAGAANRVVDLWAMFNDPTNDGAILPAFAFDPFHINHAGKVEVANVTVAMPYLANVFANPLEYSSVAMNFRQTQRSENVALNSLVLGQDDGAVRALTIRSRDPLVDEEQAFFAQYNDNTSGWMFHADAGGNLLLKRLAGGVSLVTRLLLAGLASAYSALVTKLWVQADGVNTRMSGTTWDPGGGVGCALQFSIDSGSAATISGFSAGGADYADVTLNVRSLTIAINGVPRYRFNSDATVSNLSIPYYASRAAATSALGAGKDFFNTTTESKSIS